MASAPSVRARLGAAGLASLCLMVGAGGARAQAALHGRVVDELDGTPVAGATILLREVGLADSARSELDGEPLARRTATDEEGRYRLGGLTRGRYAITVDRFGYGSARLEVTLDRDDPLSVSVLLEPMAFRLAPIALRRLRGVGPSLIEPGPGADVPGPERTDAIRVRQRRYLSGDVRQLGHADIRESNTLGEDDLFRALQTLPGVARRDDYTADLWTRGSPAGHTVVTFDGVPVMGALHALGAMAGLNSDMLGTATFQPGVVGASSQGAAAAAIAVESRSPATGPRSTRVGVSPISARFTTDGRPSDRVAWAVGARRSHFDLWSALLDGLSPGGREFRYAFGDVTGRADLVLSPRSRIEVSGFFQDDRVFGEVAGLAAGNEGVWGTRVARASLVTAYDGLMLRHTGGVSGFNASVKVAASDPAPTHPPTENHFRTLVWESRIDGAPGTPEPWSLGLTVRREGYDYNGPAVGPASLLTPEELARRGNVDLTPLLVGLGRERLHLSGDATRIALWGERRVQLGSRLEMEAGIRVETGDAIQGERARLAPRLLVRYRRHDSPIAISAGYGRAYQYTQSIGRTDVLRSGLRVSELLAHAGDDTPALRSDLATIGMEAWGGEAWLFGVTGWLRGTAGIVTRQPIAGPLDQPRPAVGAVGTARGVDFSVRKLTGRVRGFANYGLSGAWVRAGDRTFEASENRRHVANLSVMTDARPTWQIGGTVRLESGAPFTRVTLISTACRAGEDCGNASPVLLGTTGGQRGPTFASVDLMTDWTHEFSSWSLSVYAQLRNVLGRSNAVTYHSSCLCVDDDAGNEGWLADHFDRGLPRLPVVGLRARF